MTKSKLPGLDAFSRVMTQRDGQELVTGPAPVKTIRYQRTVASSTTQTAEWAVSVRWQPDGGRIMDDILQGQTIQEFADEITNREWANYRQGPMWPVKIVVDNNVPTALYRSGVIKVPYGVRTIVVLHELAHHLAGAVPGPQEYHGTIWVRAYLELIAHTYGAAIAEQYRLSFQQQGVVT